MYTAHVLNTAAPIPPIGLGTWQSKPGEVEKAVLYAIDEVGYRLIDGAWMYENEAEVGKAIREAKTPRSEIFVTTKLWCTYHTRAEQGLEDSLKKLGLDYVDLYLMHWPIPMPPTDTSIPTHPNGNRHILPEEEWSYIDTWKAMESLLKSGKCRAIGVSNMSIPFLERLLKECTVIPAVDQVECHPLLPQRELLDFCNKKGILLQAYSPLGSTDSPLLSDPDIKKIADAHNATVGQVLISWQVMRGVCVLPKSVTPSRIKENFTTVPLSKEEMEVLEKFAETHGGTKRFINPPWGRDLGEKDGFGATSASDQK